LQEISDISDIMEMKLDVQRIPSQGMPLSYRVAATSFATLKSLVDNGECEFTKPVDFSLKVMLEQDLILIQGRFDTRIALACSRCLEKYETKLSQSFSLRFSRQIPQDVHFSDTDEIEITASQIGLIYFEGDGIDLKDSLQEQIVLALPYKPLCRQDCKGLCPQCGTDLNHEICQCKNQSTSSPFSVLKNLKLPSG
jgi:uncharacterized protein